MKKRIFIGIHYLEIGGAEISLIGLLQSLDYSRYDVDLFVYSHRGELMDLIPKEVNLLPQTGRYAFLEEPMLKTIRHGYFSIAFRRLMAKRRFRAYARRHPGCGNYPMHHILAENLLGALPSLEKFGEYDLAISFLQPHNIILKKVKAKKKICWIHTDYGNIGGIPEGEQEIWDGYDHIVSISDDVTKSFLARFPKLKSKVVLMHNILSEAFVMERAESVPYSQVEKEIPRKEGVTNLLSVGRFCYAKNYDNVPQICRIILDSGCNVCWYIIGYGTDEALIRENIRKFEVEDNVIILGKKSNPYPYMKACDIYVQPSRYEGNSVTVREAQILRRPVVITAYDTAKSQVDNGIDGIIVPLENSGCAEGIAKLISDPRKINSIVSEQSRRDYTNQKEVSVLDGLLM